MSLFYTRLDTVLEDNIRWESSTSRRNMLPVVFVVHPIGEVQLGERLAAAPGLQVNVAPHVGN